MTKLKYITSGNNWMDVVVRYDAVLGWTFGYHNNNYRRIITERQALFVIKYLQRMNACGKDVVNLP